MLELHLLTGLFVLPLHFNNPRGAATSHPAVVRVAAHLSALHQHTVYRYIVRDRGRLMASLNRAQRISIATRETTKDKNRLYSGWDLPIHRLEHPQEHRSPLSRQLTAQHRHRD